MLVILPQLHKSLAALYHLIPTKLSQCIVAGSVLPA